MLNITGLNRFFFVCNFHDMRCKYDKVLSIIHQQLNCEPEDGDVFIVMSKDYVCKQSFRAVLCTSIYISTFVPNLNFGQDEHKRRRQVLCLNGS